MSEDVMDCRWVYGAVASAELQPGDLVDVSPWRVEPVWCTVRAVAVGCAEVWADPDASGGGEDRWACPVDDGCVRVLVVADGDDGGESPWWHVGAWDAVYARFRAEVDAAQAGQAAGDAAAAEAVV